MYKSMHGVACYVTPFVYIWDVHRLRHVWRENWKFILKRSIGIIVIGVLKGLRQDFIHGIKFRVTLFTWCDVVTCLQMQIFYCILEFSATSFFNFKVCWQQKCAPILNFLKPFKLRKEKLEWKQTVYAIWRKR